MCLESRAHKVIQVDQATQGRRVSQGHQALMAPRVMQGLKDLQDLLVSQGLRDLQGTEDCQDFLAPLDHLGQGASEEPLVRLDQWVNLEVKALQDLTVWQDLLDLQDLLENKDLRGHQEKQGLQVSLVDQVIRDQWGHQGHQDPVEHQDCLVLQVPMVHQGQQESVD